jgi:hypothetical protein
MKIRLYGEWFDRSKAIHKRDQSFSSPRWKPKQTFHGLTEQTNQHDWLKTTEKYITASKNVTNSSQATKSSSGTAYASDSMLKSYSSSSTSHQNQKNNNASIKLNPKPVAKTRKGITGPVQICNRYASWIMIIRRMNPYEIFLRMIHHLLWMSRHQKQGDRRPYLQRGVGRKCPKGSKTFPCSYSDNGTDHPMDGV